MEFEIDSFGRLKNVIVNDGETDVVIPEGVVSITSLAFKDAMLVRSIKMPSTLKEILKDSFSYCLRLSSVELNDGLIYIADGAFSNTNIKSLTIPNSVKRIGDYAFSLSKIECIRLSRSLNYIGRDILPWCGRIKEIYLPIEMNVEFSLTKIPKNVIVHFTSKDETIFTSILETSNEVLGLCTRYINEVIRSGSVQAFELIRSKSIKNMLALFMFIESKGDSPYFNEYVMKNSYSIICDIIRHNMSEYYDIIIERKLVNSKNVTRLISKAIELENHEAFVILEEFKNKTQKNKSTSLKL